jgi:hypothetical protein
MVAVAARKKAPQKSRKKPDRRESLPASRGGDALTLARFAFALAELEHAGALAGTRSKKLSMRVDPGLIEAARKRTGLRSNSDLINAALAVIAAGDDFGAWLGQQAGRLPEDFELAL